MPQLFTSPALRSMHVYSQYVRMHSGYNSLGLFGKDVDAPPPGLPAEIPL